MKGLLKYLSPFAPDQSGVVSVLFELGGITVICDAGGCTGNICGFDEPRWFYKKSALFSAGLRDMDAILGRDDKLVEKLKKAAASIDGKFVSIVGTPVPAVIATDFKALKKMASKRTGMPVVAVECTGTRYYDNGASDAYMELFRTFTEAQTEIEAGRVGVIGATPLDLNHINAGRVISEKLLAAGYKKVDCYGMGAGIDEIKTAANVEKNIVVAPSGLRAARYLEKKYGTPYETAFFMLTEEEKAEISKHKGQKVLVINQQMCANEIRNLLGGDNVDVASFFMLDDEYRQDNDMFFKGEDELIKAALEGGYDCIIGDKMLKRAIKGYEGEFVHVPHFAISGEYRE